MKTSKQMNFHEIYSKLGESGQLGIYEQHGGGTLSKRPVVNPLTGENEKDNPAFSLLPTNGNGKIRFKCHKSEETGDLFDFLVKRYGKADAEEIITSTARLPANNNRNLTDKRGSQNNKAYAMELWKEAKNDTGRIEEYLTSRSITLSVPDSLRFHNKENMMVARVSDSNGKIQAIHRTFFKEDGSRDKKQMLGPVSGGSVHLATATEKVAVCEGIETGLSFQQATGIPTHAALSVSGMQNYVIPYGVKELYIIADSDKKHSKEAISKQGQKAAKAIAEKAVQKDIKVVIVYPCDSATSDTPEKMDFNDLLQKDHSGGLIRQRLETAKEYMSSEKTYKKISLFDEEGKKKSQSTILIEIALTQELFHSQEKDSYAILEIDGHREVWPLTSKTYKDWLHEQFFNMIDKGANRNSITDALSTIECVAKFKRKCRPVHLRVAKHEDKIYIDLSDSEWRVVEIDKTGWRIIDKSPVLFIRKKGMASFPLPTPGGKVDSLWDFLNVKEKDKPLVLGYLLSSLHPKGPYIILILVGEQDTAKSTAARVLRLFIDPSVSLLRSPPKDERDFHVGCVNNWCIAIDNLSGIQAWFSDALCRVSTGGAFSGRALYTDTDEILIDILRPVILNGIDNIATRPDLAERSILLNLQPIPDNKMITEEDFYKKLDEARPAILGALFDAIAGALREIANIHIPRLPRMADATKWATAAEKTLGLKQGAFMQAYRENLRTSVVSGLEASPVARALMVFMQDREEWHGTSTNLLSALTELVDEQTHNSKAWPKSSNWVSNYLRRLGNPLRKLGYEVTLPEQSTDRTISIVRQTTK